MRPAVIALCAVVSTFFFTAPAEAAYNVGDPIADFTLNDAYGNPVSLYDFENMVIWLVFWTDT